MLSDRILCQHRRLNRKWWENPTDKACLTTVPQIHVGDIYLISLSLYLINLSIYLIYLSIYLSTYLYLYQFIYLFIYLNLNLNLNLNLSIYLINLPTYLPIYLSIDLPIYLSIYLSNKLIHCTYVFWETLDFPCLCEFYCWRVTSAIPFCIGIKPF